jgi:hypothetical protein
MDPKILQSIGDTLGSREFSDRELRIINATLAASRAEFDRRLEDFRDEIGIASAEDRQKLRELFGFFDWWSGLKSEAMKTFVKIAVGAVCSALMLGAAIKLRLLGG